MKFKNEIKSYHIGLWQARAFRVLKSLTSEYLNKHNLTPLEWAFLGILYDHSDNALPQKKIADILGTSEPFIAKIVKKMLAKNFIEKNINKGDRRNKLIQISKEGKAFINKHEKPLRAFMSRRLSLPSHVHLLGYFRTIETISKKELHSGLVVDNQI